MNRILKAALLALPLLAAPAISYAYMGETVGDDGDGAAGIGANIYNYYHPDSPLPVGGGNIVPDTLYNMGAGQSLPEAESNAAMSNSGQSGYAAPQPWTPPPTDPYAQVPYYSTPESNAVPVSSTPEPSYTPPSINFFSGSEPVSGGTGTAPACEASGCSAQ